MEVQDARATEHFWRKWIEMERRLRVDMVAVVCLGYATIQTTRGSRFVMVAGHGERIGLLVDTVLESLREEGQSGCRSCALRPLLRRAASVMIEDVGWPQRRRLEELEMAVYKLSGYPKQLRLSDGSTVSVRPMVAGDAKELLEFFQRVPDEERYFLKDSVVSESVINGWANHLDYDRALPLLAFDGERICADGVLIRHRGDARSHYAEVRVVVDPEYRRHSLGTAIMRAAIDIAWDAEIDAVQIEFVDGIQDDARKAALIFGGEVAGTLKDAVRDHSGSPHDVIFMRIPLGRSWQWSRY